MSWRWRLPVVAATMCAIAVSGPIIGAKDDDRAPLSVTVSFGAGLNTAQPGNSANHHVLPPKFTVRKGGVVNFVVAGFHWIYIFNPGTKVADVQQRVPPAGLFVFDPANPDPADLFYKGLEPAQNPPGSAVRPPTIFPTLNQMNRVESVSFPNKGTYLVICNVRAHFLDGMTALIKVVDDHDDDDN